MVSAHANLDVKCIYFPQLVHALSKNGLSRAFADDHVVPSVRQSHGTIQSVELLLQMIIFHYFHSNRMPIISFQKLPESIVDVTPNGDIRLVLDPFHVFQSSIVFMSHHDNHSLPIHPF